MILEPWLKQFFVDPPLIAYRRPSNLRDKLIKASIPEPRNQRPELGTLEWITFNPNYLIRISTVETFNFSP